MHDPVDNERHDRHPHRKSAVGLTVTPNWRELLAANGWRTLDDVFGLENDASLSKPGLPRWRERLRVGLTDESGREIAVYVKRFHGIPLSQQIGRCRRAGPGRGTAWTEWYWLRELARAGIPAAEPIAYGAEMIGWWERRSAVVMKAVEGVSLERWCARHAGRRLPRAVAIRLAELVARFHALGIAHRDLYLSHIFGADLDTAAPQLSIIDLQRVLRTGLRRRRWLVKDLAALNYSTPPPAASLRDRVRWLRQYDHLCGVCGKGDSGEYTDAGTARDPDAARAEARGSRAERQRGKLARLQRSDRVRIRWIVRKTEQMRRHDARRRRNA